MNITENEKKLILETLEEYYSPFLSMDTLCGEEWEYIDWSDFDRKFDLIDSEHGASKGVLIPCHKDYVIKVPFDGDEWTDEQEYDEELQEYTDKYYPVFNYFELVWNTWRECPVHEETPRYNDKNYCECEVFLYERAKQNDLEKFFPETQYIGEVSGRPIYVQEKTKVWNNQIAEKTVTQQDIDKIAKISKENDINFSINNYFLVSILKNYGAEDLIRFLLFVKKEKIRDLHECNLGLIDGMPVVLDFSGFRG